MRLDLYLTSYNLISGREKAKELIKKNGVTVNGKVVNKPSADILENDVVEIIGELPRYVGRGGYKLEKALEVFSVNLDGKKCIDFGASTGGFTDCMLKNGAAVVYSVDVGHGQLDSSLIADSRVKNLEGMDIRNLSIEDINGKADFIGCDVSFISLTHILPKLSELLKDSGEAVLLIKPQFECGKENIGKNGIVKSEKVHVSVLERMLSSFCENGLVADKIDYSPICGGDGNIEYIAHIVFANNNFIDFDIKNLVKNSFLKLKSKDES